MRGSTHLATVLLWASTLSAYLGVVYLFSFSQASNAARSAINLALLTMDALLLVLVLPAWKAVRLDASHSPDRSAPRSVLVAGGVCLAGVALLHTDYILARYEAAEYGWTGSLESLKINLLAVQLGAFACLSFAVRNRELAVRGRRVLTGRPSDTLLILLVVPPLAQYWIRNPDVFTVWTGFEYLLLFLSIPLVVLLGVRAFGRWLGAAGIAAPLVAALAFVHYLMPQVSSWLQRPVETLFAVRLTLVIIVPAALALLYLMDRKATASAVTIFVSLSVVGALVQAAGARDEPATDVSRSPGAAASSEFSELFVAKAVRRPDVYLLVYDGYASSAMMRHYGIDDGAMGEYLSERGFRTYDRAYSLFLASRPSMAAVLDMRRVPRAGIGGPTSATQFFRAQGYRTFLVLNSYLLQGSEPFAADVIFPAWHYRAGLEQLYRGVAGGEFKTEVVFQDSDREEWLAAKRSALAADPDQPKMLYAHSGFPGHSQNSGRCLPDETQRYADRVAEANAEMTQDIETILRTAREAIVVIAADHGAYLTGDCLYMASHSPEELTALHLGDRYGTRLAIRWTAGADAAADRIEVVQDVFFAIAHHLSGNASIWRHRLPRETIGYGGIPNAAVRNGIITIGPDAGRPLLP